MAHTLYFTRHGETFWNVENKICGATDIALTPRGHDQARALGAELARQGLAVDRILCSPLRRAHAPPPHIAAATGWPLQVEPRLREQNFGRFEGTPRDGLAFKAAKGHFVERFDGGESMLQVAARVYSLLDELAARQDTCLLVAHNGIARVVHSYFCELTNEEYAAFGIHNCELRTYRFP